jgi:citrate synthase
MTEPVKPAYSPGLEGVIAGESAICWVDPNAGLLYRGYDVHELAERASFEEVVFLLLHGELPTDVELAELIGQLDSSRAVPGAVSDVFGRLPRGTHPMEALRTGLSMLAAFDPDLNDHAHAANLRKAVRIIAKTSTLVTSGWRILHGEEPLPARDGLTHAGRFLYKLTGEAPPDWKIEVLDKIFILYAEHDFNASTFSARVTASTMSDIYAAITTALGTLKGPLHGGANEEAMNVLREIGSPDRAEAWLAGKLARREKVMGFGHRVYKKGDSRVPMMREICRQLGARYGQPHWVAICERLEALMQDQKQICANVDLYAAPVFHMLGIDPSLNTPIFAAARVAGWCAHVIEQHDHNRLIRPRSLYTGPARRPLPRD